YLGEKNLYDQFKLDESWNSPHNKKLLDKMPSVLGTASTQRGGASVYRIFVGPGTVFEDPQGVLLTDIRDGPGQTIAIVETDQGVPWTKPDELLYSRSQPLPKMNAALFVDGSLRILSPGLDETTRRALLTRNGGETVNLAQLPNVPGPLLAQ